MKQFLKAMATGALLWGACSASAQAQDIFSGHFKQQGGGAVYHGICQGCHMPNAKGATGAGTYPALAGDTRLAVAGYPVAVVVNGQRDMPNFGAYMSDQQIADVINYVRTHFGNHYTDAVTPEQVKMARPNTGPATSATKKSIHD